MLKPDSNRRTVHRRWHASVAYWVRWLHTYLSLVAFAALLFFAVTGLTVNHPNWFGGDVRESEAEGTLPAELLDQLVSADVEATPAAIVAFLRRNHQVRGAVSETRGDERECFIGFKGPGYLADATIERQSGEYRVSQSRHGLVAVINDLHKGRDSGRAWSLVIDISAILMVVVSITGLWLLFYLKRRLVAGLITAAVGTLAIVVIYWAIVP